MQGSINSFVGFDLKAVNQSGATFLALKQKINNFKFKKRDFINGQSGGRRLHCVK